MVESAEDAGDLASLDVIERLASSSSLRSRHSVEGRDGPRRAGGAPQTSPILAMLQQIFEEYLPDRTGEVATYIPELARVEPDQFGIAIVTTDGHAYEIGASQTAFTVQSISKPLIYGLALLDHGRDEVLRKIGVEPSGDPFNAIIFDERNNRPFNAMVNAGAIAATALIRGEDRAQRMARILDLFRAFTGHEATVDEAVYRSESETGHRNRAIAYLELNNGMITGDADAHLDLYFRQCAIETSALDLAMMGATLANDGVNPRTGERALPSEAVRDVMSVMTTCGMYDYAGEWELRVGLPAKSGVGGGIMAVLPGQLGVGVFSPRLDPRGNSHRGIRACEALATRLKLHLLDYRGSARSDIRRVFRGSQIRSKRVRPPAANRMLDRLGDGICIFELQGNMFFGSTERAIRRILAETEARYIILDLGRVAATDDIAAGLLSDIWARLARAGRTLLFAAVPPDLQQRLAVDAPAIVPDFDRALEQCENAVLAEHEAAATGPAALPRIQDFELLQKLDPDELHALGEHLVPVTFGAGEIIFREGAVADCLYFLLAGSVDVRVSSGGGITRLASIDAGNVFGELALLGTGPRTADIVAQTPVMVLQLASSDVAALAVRHPGIQEKIVTAVGRSLSERLRRANAVIRTLAR